MSYALCALRYALHYSLSFAISSRLLLILKNSEHFLLFLNLEGIVKLKNFFFTSCILWLNRLFPLFSDTAPLFQLHKL